MYPQRFIPHLHFYFLFSTGYWLLALTGFRLDLRRPRQVRSFHPMASDIEHGFDKTIGGSQLENEYYGATSPAVGLLVPGAR